ncbi:polymorphic toxin type 50 domain-containing protein [Paenibacillus sp. HWE-109]|uniref:polymorphic toxin type 50 domain-containing protein n=1 Tax=Paenibacillus sp. HWE-109 TaxID=1306526 RepID=UPI003FCDCC07
MYISPGGGGASVSGQGLVTGILVILGIIATPIIQDEPTVITTPFQDQQPTVLDQQFEDDEIIVITTPIINQKPTVITQPIINEAGSIITFKEVNGFEAKIKAGQQEKHIVGAPNYNQELANGKVKSKFNGTLSEAQKLLDAYAGSGVWIGTNKERVDFGDIIGEYYDPQSQTYTDTSKGIIHYGKDGAHIVPARPQ